MWKNYSRKMAKKMRALEKVCDREPPRIVLRELFDDADILAVAAQINASEKVERLTVALQIVKQMIVDERNGVVPRFMGMSVEEYIDYILKL